MAQKESVKERFGYEEKSRNEEKTGNEKNARDEENAMKVGREGSVQRVSAKLCSIS